MPKQYWWIVLTVLLVVLSLTGCSSSTPAANMPRIRASEYQDYYMSSWKLEFDGGVLYTDEPSGTGSDRVNAYIRLTDGEEQLLTPCMGAFVDAYLSGEWLYFSYAALDESVYDTCRMKIRSPETLEFLGVNLLFATNDYFYYYIGLDESTVYRRDANFNNETLMPFGINFRWSLFSAGDKIISFHDNPYRVNNTVITVYDQDGAALYDVQVNSKTTERYFANDGVFYWCDYEESENGSTHTFIHRINLNDNGSTEDIEVTIDVEGWVLSVVDVDDKCVYFTVDIPFPKEDTGEWFENTLLYRMPLAGGEPEFVRSWFES